MKTKIGEGIGNDRSGLTLLWAGQSWARVTKAPRLTFKAQFGGGGPKNGMARPAFVFIPSKTIQEQVRRWLPDAVF